MTVKCPYCPKECKNYFYLGQHVFKSADHQGKPGLKDSFEEAVNSEPEPETNESVEDPDTNNTGEVIEIEADEQPEVDPDAQDTGSDWRELDPEDPYEQQLQEKGFDEINTLTMEVR